MTEPTLLKEKENRIWWLVLALCSISTALLVYGSIKEDTWSTLVLILFGTFVTGSVFSFVGHGINIMTQGKAEAAKTQAEAEREAAIAVRVMAEVEQTRAETETQKKS